MFRAGFEPAVPAMGTPLSGCLQPLGHLSENQPLRLVNETGEQIAELGVGSRPSLHRPKATSANDNLDSFGSPKLRTLRASIYALLDAFPGKGGVISQAAVAAALSSTRRPHIEALSSFTFSLSHPGSPEEPRRSNISRDGWNRTTDTRSL